MTREEIIQIVTKHIKDDYLHPRDVATRIANDIVIAESKGDRCDCGRDVEIRRVCQVCDRD